MYSKNLDDLQRQINNLSFSDYEELPVATMKHFRDILAYSDPEDFPPEFDLVRTYNWHRLHSYDQQRFILKHRETGQYLRISINRSVDGDISPNDVRQVAKHYEIQAVFE